MKTTAKLVIIIGIGLILYSFLSLSSYDPKHSIIDILNYSAITIVPEINHPEYIPDTAAHSNALERITTEATNKYPVSIIINPEYNPNSIVWREQQYIDTNEQQRSIFIKNEINKSGLVQHAYTEDAIRIKNRSVIWLGTIMVLIGSFILWKDK